LLSLSFFFVYFFLSFSYSPFVFILPLFLPSAVCSDSELFFSRSVRSLFLYKNVSLCAVSL
jgi:hypothetical protein